jgi:FeS assembly SUF system protein
MSENASRQLEMDLEAAPAAASDVDPFTAEIIKQLKTVFDPEIPVDVYELGLIYKIDVADNKDVNIDMTLTAPACPVAGEMPGWVKEAVLRVPGVGNVEVAMVFDPPWTPERMSEEARLELNMF